MKQSIFTISRRKLLLWHTLVLLFLFSCKKDLPAEFSEGPAGPPASAQSPAAIPSNANLVFEETFETSPRFSTARLLEIGTWDYAMQYVPNPDYPGQVFQGNSAVRFEIREDQPLVENGKRAEVEIVNGSKGDITKNTWYSFAVYFAGDGPESFLYDVERECLNQWKTDGTPATSFRTKKDRYLLETGNSSSNRKQIDLGPLDKGNWTEWVFHFIHSYYSDGLIEVWRNGVKVLTHTGGNMYQGVLPRWKVGLYKAAWVTGESLVDVRVNYYDNIRVGNANASFADMTSGVALPPPPPPLYPQRVVRYVLVNASTNQDIMELTNGAVITRSVVGTYKFNIRAETDPLIPGGGCVQMKLSGKASKSTTDDKVPYALYGDNGAGDYYSWSASAGNYTLKATPYSGNKSDKGATTGLEYSINFTIK